MNPVLRSLHILFSGLLAGQVIFCGVVFFLILNKEITPGQIPEGIAWGVTGVVVLTTTTMSTIIFRIRIASVSEKPLAERLVAYRATALVRWALLESGVFLPAAMTLTSGMLLLLLTALLPLAVFITTFPSNMRVAADLNCDPRDLDELQN